MDSGFLRVASCVTEIKISNCDYNAGRINEMIDRAAEGGVALAVFPELCITGYTCGDLFNQRQLVRDAGQALFSVIEHTRKNDICVIVGLPVIYTGKLYNAAAVIKGGELLGVVPKSYLPNYSEFYEQRWFTSGASISCGSTVELCGHTIPFSPYLVFGEGETTFSVEICEDLWAPIPPSSYHAVAGASVILNLSASDEVASKNDYIRALLEQQSARTMTAYLYSSAGPGESSTDLVFAGNAIVAENGRILSSSDRFTGQPLLSVTEVDIMKLSALRRSTNTFGSVQTGPQYKYIPVELKRMEYGTEFIREFDPLPFVPSDECVMDERCGEILDIQVAGLVQRLKHTGSRNAVIGISGGLDSTLALLVTVRAFDFLGLPRTGIKAVTMPGYGTTSRTYDNAITMMRNLGVDTREINIIPACEQHFKDIGIDPSDRSVTFENAQARERTQILMDIANIVGGMVIGTGDLSELALGWATYNGDIMSMYGVNCSVPKTLVRHIVKWIAENSGDAELKRVLLDIVETPVSPELLPAEDDGTISQKTEDIVGPYELHDFFLYNFLRFVFPPERLYFMACNAFRGVYDGETIKKWLKDFIRRFFASQFKRSALPDGPKVGSVSLSPRGDWRMPSDADPAGWLGRIENL